MVRTFMCVGLFLVASLIPSASTQAAANPPQERPAFRNAEAVNGSAPSVLDAQSLLVGRAELVEERVALAEAHASSLAELAAPCDSSSEAPTTPNAMPFPEALDRLEVSYAPTAACCKVCSVGIACGNTCISARYTCHVGAGCACNAYLPPIAPITPEYARLPEISLVSQSPYPRLVVGQSTELTLATKWIHGPSWFDGDVGLYVSNPAEAGVGLRGWDATGRIAVNRGTSFLSDTQQFRLAVQALAPGVHRIRMAFRHKTFGPFGPTGIYWDVVVDPLPTVQRLYEGWHSRWVTQSPYLALRPGESASFWIRFANVGTEYWQRGVMNRQANLGLNGDDRTPYSLGMAANWLWQDRIATTTALVVGPGDIAEFRFSVRAPVSPGTYRLNLRPVVDGTTWLEDEGVFWVIEVR